MRNFKKTVAMSLAATMIMGNMATAFAAEGGATGSGNYEGYVEKTSVFSVEVPTDASATEGFDFFVDPNGLLAKTNYARISGASASDFETGASLFFTRTPVAEDTENGVAAVTQYGKDSESITFTNKSSYAVNVEVSAAVTGADGITLGTVASETKDPTIYLALVTPGTEGGNTTTPITASGATVTGSIEGVEGNFDVVYKEADEGSNTEAGYYYELRTPEEGDTPLDEWETYSFNLTGACGGTWTADQAEVEPTVTLTWKVTDPKATPTSKLSVSKVSAASNTVTVTGATVKAIELIKKGAETTTTLTDPKHYSMSNGVITFSTSVLTNNVGGSLKVSYTEGGSDTLTIE